MLTTKNLGLLKPELTDPADITALNENWDKIDSLREKCKYVVDADLNDLTSEGLYYCTGTITNAPESATECIVQVFAHEASSEAVQIFYVGNFKGANTYRRHCGKNASAAVFLPWKKLVFGDCEVISDADAPIGSCYVKEVIENVEVDGSYRKLITISGSIPNALHVIKQINVGYSIHSVVSCVVSPCGDNEWVSGGDGNISVKPSFNGTTLTLTFDAYEDDGNIPCSYIVKLLAL